MIAKSRDFRSQNSTLDGRSLVLTNIFDTHKAFRYFREGIMSDTSFRRYDSNCEQSLPPFREPFAEWE